MPKLKAIYQQYHDRGFDVISVNVKPSENDGDRESFREVDSIVALDSLPWLQVKLDTVESQAVIARFGFQGVPYHLLLDAQGRLIVDGMVSHDVLLDEIQRRVLGSRDP